MSDSSLPRASLLCAIAILSVPAWADDDGLIAHLNNHVEGALGAEHLSYSELNNQVTNQLPNGADLDTESGTIFAAGVSGSWQGKLLGMQKVRGSVDLHVAFGDATYNGYLQDLQTNTLTPLTATTSETYIDLQLQAGKGFSFMHNRDQLTPYVGLGVTLWHRDLSNSPGGYTEDYENGVWKVGLEYQIQLTEKLVASVDGSYGGTFGANMTASNLPPTFELGDKPVQRYALGLRYALTKKAYMGLDGYWMHYGYGQSPAYAVTYSNGTASVLEPTSRTTRDGLMLVGGFAYR
jgi:hypothetical protein